MLIILTGLSVRVINVVSEMETSGSHGGEYEDKKNRRVVLLK
jgi:hypothetical protein